MGVRKDTHAWRSTAGDVTPAGMGSGVIQRRSALAAALLAATAGLGGCFRPPSRPVQDRIPRLRFEGRAGAPGSGTLVVMLPGVSSPPQEFVDAGFIDALAAAAPGAAAHVLDSHFGYYEDRSIVARLHAEVVQPARAQGFARVWLVGISLGGFGSLGYLARHPQAVDGVLALAPYLGPASLHREIAAGGGPRAWAAARPAPDGPGELDRALWHHLATRGDGPEVHLGHGQRDRFERSHRVLAELLPAGRVRSAPGGHDWPVWTALWRRWLAEPGAVLLAGTAPAPRA